MQDLEQAIRERAYSLWIEGGCAGRTAEEHWLAAQREVLSASPGTFARESVAKSEVQVPKKSATQDEKQESSGSGVSPLRGFKMQICSLIVAAKRSCKWRDL